jgi:photosystem II stability/assembly factor-like uncharacterized protein
MKITKASITLICILCFITNLNAQWIQVPASPTGYIDNILNSEGDLYLSHLSNGIFKSEDGGVSWQQKNNGLDNSQAKSVSEIYAFGDTLYGATVDGIYKSLNGGDNWEKKSSGITIGPGALAEFCESIFEYDGNLFTGAWNGIYISTDGAESWTVTNVTGQGIIAKNFADHNGSLFAARESINFPNGYFSTDGGLTWNPLITLNFPTINFFSEGTNLWSGTIHGVWLSTDNGVNWQSRSNGLNPDPYSSSILRVNGELITSLKFGGSGMFRSTNDGLNWEDFSDGLPFLNSIEKLIVYNNKIIAATSNGLWQRDVSQVPVELTSFSVSASGGKIHLSWSTSTETNNQGFDIFRSETNNEVKWEKIGFVAGHGTTTEPQIYSYSDEDIYGDLKYRLKQIDYDGSFQYSNIVEINSLTGLSFELNQNYPNPFNPSTRINYSISIQSHVILKVYDLIGNEIVTLIDEEKPAGEYEVEFSAKGGSASGGNVYNLPSGIYFYTLNAGEFTETKKMILLK